MPLLQEVKYKTGIKRFEDISPQSVLSMLYDIRKSVGELDGTFVDSDLAEVLSVIEAGTYEINGTISTRIDLSFAKSIVKFYREHSEGGCQSCISLGRETIDAQDATSGWYCEVSDPDFDKNAVNRPGVRYSGFSPKTNKYYQSPCKDWKPKFSPTLDKLIRQE
ncbi:MAG: hypothetical protein AABW91_02085 [Nanoarchaeota archaeon]